MNETRFSMGYMYRWLPPLLSAGPDSFPLPQKMSRVNLFLLRSFSYSVPFSSVWRPSLRHSTGTLAAPQGTHSRLVPLIAGKADAICIRPGCFSFRIVNHVHVHAYLQPSRTISARSNVFNIMMTVLCFAPDMSLTDTWSRTSRQRPGLLFALVDPLDFLARSGIGKNMKGRALARFQGTQRSGPSRTLGTIGTIDILGQHSPQLGDFSCQAAKRLLKGTLRPVTIGRREELSSRASSKVL